MIIWIGFIVIAILWTIKDNKSKIPGPFSFPFCGSLPSMTMFDKACLSYPYRVMHRLILILIQIIGSPCIDIAYRMAEYYGNVMRVMLGDQEWFILSGF